MVTLQARASMMRRRKRNNPGPCTRGQTTTKQHSRMLANTDALLESKSKETKQFRLRFRMPYPAFVELYGQTRLGQKGQQLTTTPTVLLLVRRHVAVAKDVFRVFSEKCAFKLYVTAWILLREGGDLKVRV